MKKLTSSLLWVISIITLAICTSCDKSDSSDLLNGIPYDAEMVCVFDAKTLVESAGGTLDEKGISLPTFITDLFDRDDKEFLDNINYLIKESGVDVQKMALTMMNLDGSMPVFVMYIESKQKLNDFINQAGFRSEKSVDGVKFLSLLNDGKTYYKTYTYIGVYNNILYYMPEADDDDLEDLVKVATAAKNKNFAENKMADHLMSGNLGCIAVKFPPEMRREMRKNGLPSEIVELYEGYVCINGSLESNAAKLSMKMYKEDGSDIDYSDLAFLNTDAKIDKKALTYFGADESLVIAMAIENFDWDKYFEMISSIGKLSRSEKAQLKVVKAYLENIDGTVALGMGLTNGLQSVLDMEYDPFNQCSATMVIETKDGKASSLVDDIKGLMESIQLPYTNTATGFTISIPAANNAKIYCETDNNLIILSNNKISASSDSPAVKNLDFSNRLLAMGVYIGRDNKLLKNFNLEYDLSGFWYVDTNNNSSELIFSIDGGNKEGFLAKCFEVGLDVYSHIDEINRMQSQYSNRYDPYDDPYEELFEEEDYDYITD